LETEAQEALREKQHLILVSLDLGKWRFRGYMLHFVKNFTEDRTFKVIIGDRKSEKITIDNGVVQGAVISVTLFLIAISKMADKTKQPRDERPGPRRIQTILSQALDAEKMRLRTVGILGYADDWVLYTKNH
jgi:hypothetical protein